MTACAIEPTAADENGDECGDPRTGGTQCAITADGSYAARLAPAGDCLFPERWTLDGPEPYAVPLPGNQPEEPGTEVQPMGDGRVLIRRLVDGRHAFSLLYPTGPGTGELPLGAVECPDPDTRLRLLPPAPGARRRVRPRRGPALDRRVAGGGRGVRARAARDGPGALLGRGLAGPGRADAGARPGGRGRTKAIVVDLERDGEVSPLLQIAADSDDRLLAADPDSGLLLIGSDAPAPGRGNGSGGGRRVHAAGAVPGVPAAAGLHGDAVRDPAGAGADAGELRGGATRRRTGRHLVRRLAASRHRQLLQLPAPEGWLTGTGLWTEDGVLRLPYTTHGGSVRGGAVRGAQGDGENGGPGSGDPGALGERGNGGNTPGDPVGDGTGVRLGRPRPRRRRRHRRILRCRRPRVRCRCGRHRSKAGWRSGNEVVRVGNEVVPDGNPPRVTPGTAG